MKTNRASSAIAGAKAIRSGALKARDLAGQALERIRVQDDTLGAFLAVGNDGVEQRAGAIDDRWDPVAATWVDAGPTASGSGRCRTGDALLPLLVSRRNEAISSVIDQLKDPQLSGGPFGPPRVDRTEKAFDPTAYWRGPVWPQLSYLLVQRVRRAGGEELLVEAMAQATVDGAMASGMAEYWNPDTGEGRGAIPQSWTGLALLLY